MECLLVSIWIRNKCLMYCFVTDQHYIETNKTLVLEKNTS